MSDETSQKNYGNLKGNLYVKNYLETDIKNVYNIYHYKNLGVFKKILENGFQVSNIKFFNDPKDGIMPYDEIIDFDDKKIKCHKFIKEAVEELKGEEELKDELNNILEYINLHYSVKKLSKKGSVKFGRKGSVKFYKKDNIKFGKKCNVKIKTLIKDIHSELNYDFKYSIDKILKKVIKEMNNKGIYVLGTLDTKSLDIEKLCTFSKYPISWEKFYKELIEKIEDEQTIKDEEVKSKDKFEIKLKEDLKEIFAQLERDKDDFRNNYYAISFTTQESIPMWMNYVESNDGALVKFKLNELIDVFNSEYSKHKPYIVGKVYYGKEAKEKIKELTLEYASSAYSEYKENLNKPLKDYVKTRAKYIEALQAVQLLRKRKAWAYEKEVRIIFKADHEDGFRKREEGGFIKYIEIPSKCKSISDKEQNDSNGKSSEENCAKLDLDKTISKVILSPYNSNDDFYILGVTEYLKSKGIKNVKESKLSIRKV